jgi:hypothetical protein
MVITIHALWTTIITLQLVTKCCNEERKPFFGHAYAYVQVELWGQNNNEESNLVL